MSDPRPDRPDEPDFDPYEGPRPTPFPRDEPEPEPAPPPPPPPPAGGPTPEPPPPPSHFSPGGSSEPSPGTHPTPFDQWAMAVHLSTLIGLGVSVILIGILAPLVVWQVKKDEYPGLRAYAIETINFQLNLLLWQCVAVILIFTIVGICLGWFIGVLLPIVNVVLSIVAAIRVSEGRFYRYPYIWRVLT